MIKVPPKRVPWASQMHVECWGFTSSLTGVYRVPMNIAGVVGLRLGWVGTI